MKQLGVEKGVKQFGMEEQVKQLGMEDSEEQGLSYQRLLALVLLKLLNAGEPISNQPNATAKQYTLEAVNSHGLPNRRSSPSYGPNFSQLVCYDC